MALALSLVGALATAAPAAEPMPAGYYVTPSLSVGEEYRSNIFESAHSPTSDFVTVITPGLSLGYQSEPFTLLGSYQLTSEVYARTSDLDSAVARQVASVMLRYSPDRRLTIRLDGAYTDTNDASQFAQPFTPAVGTSPTTTAGAPPATAGSAGAPGAPPAPGGAGATQPAPGTPGGPPVVAATNVGRTHGSVISAAAGASYAFDALTTLDGGYSYTRTRLSGSPDEQSHAGSLSISRQFTPKDRGSLIYRLQVFEATSAQPGLTTNSGLLGWSRQFTPELLASADIGPRFDSDGGVGVDADATLSYTFSAQGSAGLAYHHSAGLAVGQSGATLVDAGSLFLSYEPLRDLVLSLVGGITRTEPLGSSTPPSTTGTSGTGTTATSSGGSGSNTDTVYNVGLSARYRLTESVSLRFSYQFSHDVQSGRSNIDEHIAGLYLDWSYPFRLQ